MLKILRCDPRLFEKDLKGRVYVLTGANSGIGFATMRQLVRQGAHVVAGCREVAPAAECVRSLYDLPGSVEIMRINLGNLASVRRFAVDVLEKHKRIHGLINNAGVMNTPKGKTDDGFETQFGVNHLGPFLLTELLLDRLRASAPSRIICVSSVAHVGFQSQPGEMDLDDLNFETREYKGFAAYNQSKLANVLHALHLAKRLAKEKVTAVSVNPGWVRTRLIKHTVPVWAQNIILRPLSIPMALVSPEDGAQTSLHCLLDDEVPDHSGAYFSQCGIFYPDPEDRPGGWPMESPNPHARDTKLAARLHAISLQMVGLAPGGPQKAAAKKPAKEAASAKEKPTRKVSAARAGTTAKTAPAKAKSSTKAKAAPAKAAPAKAPTRKKNAKAGSRTGGAGKARS